MSEQISPKTVSIPHDGFLDLHSHLLPGIDDGCRTIEDSIRCVERLKSHGFVGTVCTPHYGVNDFPHNVPEQIVQFVAKLREELAERDLEYQLWDGAEVRLHERTIAWFEDHGIPTLGPGRCVLVDFWGDAWPACCDQVLDYLLDREFLPILAHPERMNLPEVDLEHLLERLKEKGVWLQGNLNSVSGGEGRLARDRMVRWLDNDWYDYVATDMHAPMHLDGRMNGIGVLETIVGEDTKVQMLGHRPREVLLHALKSS
ncbi:MAG: tyrosine-protein phosphatase [Gemmataceae bacterium]